MCVLTRPRRGCHAFALLTVAWTLVASKAGQVAVQTVIGSSHKCSILEDAYGRVVKCWGGNDYGQLGQGDTKPRGQFEALVAPLGYGVRPVQLVGGIHHTCVLFDNGRSKCWGANYRGQLGQGDMDNRGDSKGEMGDQLLPIDLGTGRTAVQLAAGDYHTCALLDNGSVKCWGGNDKGQLGDGGRRARGWYAGGMGNSLPAIAFPAGCKAVAVVAGPKHTCTTLDCGPAQCWGVNAIE